MKFMFSGRFPITGRHFKFTTVAAYAVQSTVYTGPRIHHYLLHSFHRYLAHIASAGNRLSNDIYWVHIVYLLTISHLRLSLTFAQNFRENMLFGGEQIEFRGNFVTCSRKGVTCGGKYMEDI